VPEQATTGPIGATGQVAPVGAKGLDESSPTGDTGGAALPADRDPTGTDGSAAPTTGTQTTPKP
jgi:hypothetical protein